jgi:ATP-dependent DNA ligase
VRISERGEELGREGVVAKPLSSTYIPGRRRTAWMKHKVGREERLAVTVVRRTGDAVAEAVFVARALPDGSLVGSGSVEMAWDAS